MKEIDQVGGLHPRPELKLRDVRPSVHLAAGSKTLLIQLDFGGPNAVDDAMLMFDRIAIELQRGSLELKMGPFNPVGTKR